MGVCDAMRRVDDRKCFRIGVEGHGHGIGEIRGYRTHVTMRKNRRLKR